MKASYLLAVMAAAEDLMPDTLRNDRTVAMLGAIAHQELGPGLKWRAQQPNGGPALGLWQFEKAGVTGVVTHTSTRDMLKAFARELNYRWQGSLEENVNMLHEALHHNDVLAAGIARLNLWWIPSGLPRAAPESEQEAYEQYDFAWRPGKKRPEDWPASWRYGLALWRGEAPGEEICEHPDLVCVVGRCTVCDEHVNVESRQPSTA